MSGPFSVFLRCLHAMDNTAEPRPSVPSIRTRKILQKFRQIIEQRFGFPVDGPKSDGYLTAKFAQSASTRDGRL